MKSINHIFTETMYLKKINDAGLCLMGLYTSYILFLLPLEYHLSLFCYTINQASLCGTTSVRDLHFQISGVFICSINNISPGMVVVITLILPQCTLCIGFQLLFTHVPYPKVVSNQVNHREKLKPIHVSFPKHVHKHKSVHTNAQ